MLSQYQGQNKKELIRHTSLVKDSTPRLVFLSHLLGYD
jgi:hypothetical protein